ncbi:CaiB/BaiF CoA transferase family protein [Alicycliphilus denitrificans]|uniref:CoA transferase n=1 Tax=Alicycliphilus denitrificans TaxID=179636 RepID=A0A420KC73_9BURK|nr:CoA transferase [Alicycliphilus denitrificans]RKJ96724.1 CoA transferase [Alicycliphilus denitrificans]
MPNALARPLEGIRVLDLTVALAGPYGSLLLGGMGAEVIHVESPGGGDIARTNPPFVGAGGIHFGGRREDEISLTVLNRARNKKSVTLDLKSPQGHALFMRLAKECDVVIENMSEGATARLGVDYERVREANPRIVYASIKAFGEPSPSPGLKGMDIIVQALSGIMEVTGPQDGPPTRWGLPIADLLAPMFAVQGVMAALIHRGRTGEGQHVQVSMLDCLASLLAEEHFDVMSANGYPLRSGNFHDRLAPFGVYPARDGHVAIVAFSDEWMAGLLDAMGQPQLADDPRFAHRGIRMKHAAELNALIAAWTGGLDAEDVVRELQHQRGVPCVRVRTPLQVLNDPLLHASGALTQLAHPRLGGIGAIGMGLPIRFSRTPSQFDQPAAELGSANAEIYRGLLRLGADEMAALQTAGVI